MEDVKYVVKDGGGIYLDCNGKQDQGVVALVPERPPYMYLAFRKGMGPWRIGPAPNQSWNPTPHKFDLKTKRWLNVALPLPTPEFEDQDAAELWLRIANDNAKGTK